MIIDPTEEELMKISREEGISVEQLRREWNEVKPFFILIERLNENKKGMAP